MASCGFVVAKKSDIDAADFGVKPTEEEALELAKASMRKRLYDPYSAVYECQTVRKAWANLLGTIYYGYAFTCDINAKNRYAAYVGSKTYNFLINSNKVILKGWARVVYLD